MNLSRIALAVAVAGTLDITSAILTTEWAGKSAIGMLQSVASGPFGSGLIGTGLAGAALGLATHFAIMTVMALAFAIAVDRVPLASQPLIAGPAYGALLYLVMYWIVLPLRWPGPHSAISIKGTLVPLVMHILLVGMPIALILRRRPVAAGKPGGQASADAR
ncbi:MAG: hypothetical protein WDN24_07625 [Sphingomonas sp.]